MLVFTGCFTDFDGRVDEILLGPVVGSGCVVWQVLPILLTFVVRCHLDARMQGLCIFKA